MMGRQSLNLRRVRARKRALRAEWTRHEQPIFTWLVGPQYIDCETPFRDLKRRMTGME